MIAWFYSLPVTGRRSLGFAYFFGLALVIGMCAFVSILDQLNPPSD